MDRYIRGLVDKAIITIAFELLIGLDKTLHRLLRFLFRLIHSFYI